MLILLWTLWYRLDSSDLRPMNTKGWNFFLTIRPLLDSKSLSLSFAYGPSSLSVPLQDPNITSFKLPGSSIFHSLGLSSSSKPGVVIVDSVGSGVFSTDWDRLLLLRLWYYCSWLACLFQELAVLPKASSKRQTLVSLAGAQDTMVLQRLVY